MDSEEGVFSVFSFYVWQIESFRSHPVTY